MEAWNRIFNCRFGSRIHESLFASDMSNVRISLKFIHRRSFVLVTVHHQIRLVIFFTKYIYIYSLKLKIIIINQNKYMS